MTTAALLALAYSTPSVADWPGWRGGPHNGLNRVADPTVEWATDCGVRWQIPLPGRGYSSPVVSGDRVYVTAAYPAERTATVTRTLDAVVAALVAAATLLFAVLTLRPDRVDPVTPVARTFAAVIAMGAITLTLFGPSVLGVEKSANRAWAAAVIVPVAWAVAALAHTRPRSGWRVAIAGALLAVCAGGAIADIPGATTDSPPTLGSDAVRLWVAVNAVPLVLVGWVAARWYRPGTGRPSLPDTADSHPKLRRLAIGLAITAAAAGVLVVAQPVWNADAWNAASEDENYGALLNPAFVLVPRSWLPAALAAAAALALVRRRTGGAWPRIGLLSAAAAVAILLAAVAGFEVLTRHSPFLSSRLGTVRPEPAGGWWVVWGVAVSGGVGSVLAHIPATSGPRLWAARLLPAVLLSLVAGTWANTHFVRPVAGSAEFVRAIVCVRAVDGRVEWVCEGLAGSQPPTGRQNSPASPTAVVSGDRVYGYFGSAGLMSCDQTGRLLWTNTDLLYESSWGVASSPVVAGGTVVVVSDPPAGTAWVWGIDCDTGRVRWSRTWAADSRNQSGNCRTPVVTTVRGREAVVVCGFDRVQTFAADTGEELGAVAQEPRAMDIVASPVVDGGRLYLARTGETTAFRLDALGTSGAMAWTTRKAGATCSSPVVVDGLVYLVTDGGVAHCLDANTGRLVWQERLRGQYFASVVATGRYVFFHSTSGRTTVIRCGREFEVVAENDLGEDCFATPAMAGDRLFIRTDTRLYCLGR